VRNAGQPFTNVMALQTDAALFAILQLLCPGFGRMLFPPAATVTGAAV
jgi:hypothetical protein